ncbi:hypothetical protein [Leucobacter sp. wl10]|uniref:hypothetical protein n=1 Tax=Leucobacter sp. wl10 TaxID=2304677 RepID=UPI001F08CEA5|nr:hypothetical protein [Leucobacter sp. wl10]
MFDQLAAMNLVTLHTDEDAAREHITAHAQDGEAITVATNDEAAELNERIGTGRVERGEVDDTVTATGSDGLSIGAGDLIQTRKNSSDLGVANRQQWLVQRVTDEGTVYAREVSNAGKHLRTVALPAEYVGEHAHLSYAATAYGVQGATVDASHTMLSGATSAAGVYVGALTRLPPGDEAARLTGRTRPRRRRDLVQPARLHHRPRVHRNAHRDLSGRSTPAPAPLPRRRSRYPRAHPVRHQREADT